MKLKTQDGKCCSTRVIEGNTVEFSLTIDYNRYYKECLINTDTFCEICDLLLILINKYWEPLDRSNKLNWYNKKYQAHVCPINTRVVNNHVYRHTYQPRYTCCEENVVTNEQCGSCCQFR